VERTAKGYDYGREGKRLRIRAEIHDHKGDTKQQKIIIVLIIAQSPFWQEARKQNASAILNNNY
jgi:hypothetical protein